MAKTFGANDSGAIADDVVNEIADNKTLLATKCTQLPARSPEIKEGLNSTAAVFDYYQPNHTIFFENTRGAIKKETFQYRSITDFDIKSVVKQSSFLKDTKEEKERYLEMAKKISTDIKLQQILKDPIAKKDLLRLIKSLKETIKKQQA